MKKVQPVQNTFFPERKRKPPQLKWSMTILMLLCWLLPLAILTMAILTYVSNRFSGQMRENIEKSMDTAVEICEMRVEAAVRVSRNASYIPQIKESWRQYQSDGNRLGLYEKVTTFLEQMYRYDSSFYRRTGANLLQLQQQ